MQFAPGLKKTRLNSDVYNNLMRRLVSKYSPRNHWHTEANLRKPILAVYHSICEMLEGTRSKPL